MASCALDRSVEAVDGSTVDQYAAGACAPAAMAESVLTVTRSASRVGRATQRLTVLRAAKTLPIAPLPVCRVGKRALRTARRELCKS